MNTQTIMFILPYPIIWFRRAMTWGQWNLFFLGDTTHRLIWRKRPQYA
jgi:hypothetical protein